MKPYDSSLFHRGNLNGDHYWALLHNDVIPILANFYPDPGMHQVPVNTLWFQQDGSPPHYQFNGLDSIFQSLRASIEYPARLLDLSLLDLFFMGMCIKLNL